MNAHSVSEATALPVVPASPRKRRVRLFALREDVPRPVYVLAGIGFIALVLAAWSIATYGGYISDLFLPTPSAVVQEGIEQYEQGILVEDARASIYRIVVGWGIATLFALPFGLLMGNFKFIEGLLEPFIDIVRYMPVVALVPLTILWAGIGDEQKFVILFIGTFFQEVLLIMDNVKTVPQDLIRVGYTLGMSRLEILRDIILPASLPGIWDTFRITLGWTWTYLVVAELVAARDGLGRRIMEAQRYLATEQIIFGILFIGLLGIVTDYFFKITGGSLFKWTRER